MTDELTDLTDLTGFFDTAPDEVPVVPVAPQAPLTDLPTALLPIAARRPSRSRNARGALVVDALDVATAALAVMRSAFTNGTADVDDAIRILPIVHNVIAHVEKLEAARNVKPNWPTMNIEFTAHGGFIVHAVTTGPTSAEPRLLETDD